MEATNLFVVIYISFLVVAALITGMHSYLTGCMLIYSNTQITAKQIIEYRKLNEPYSSNYYALTLIALLA